MYRIILALAISSFLWQCSPVTVAYTKQVESKSLADYKTFDFMDVTVENQSSWQPHASNTDRVKDLITRELEARGLKYSESDPDLLVNLGAVIDDKTQTRETDIRDAPIYMGTRNYHWESEDVVVREYQEGTLMLDLVDAGSKELIWQSAVKSTMTNNSEKMEKRIEAAVDELFKSFPS